MSCKVAINQGEVSKVYINQISESQFGFICWIKSIPKKRFMSPDDNQVKVLQLLTPHELIHPTLSNTFKLTWDNLHCSFKYP